VKGIACFVTDSLFDW